jgi:predicted SAM-dependent methyltransferase
MKATSRKARLKRSQFVVGAARTVRGMIQDLRTLTWIAGRTRKITNYFEANSITKLQLGTSDNILDGWLNTDIDPLHQSVVYLDATSRFPFADNAFDYVMAEHMIEHIEYNGAERMLKECFRVLKPSGRVRLPTPDLDVMLALRSTKKTGIQRRYLNWATTSFLPGVEECKDVFVINNFFQSWGHRFLYDRETLGRLLEGTGFQDVQFYKPGSSDDVALQNLETHGRKITEESNQFETMVAEARKSRQFEILIRPYSIVNSGNHESPMRLRDAA